MMKKTPYLSAVLFFCGVVAAAFLLLLFSVGRINSAGLPWAARSAPLLRFR